MHDLFRSVVTEPHGKELWEASVGDLLDSMADGIYWQVGQWLSVCQSPIEVKFGIGLARVAWYEIAELDGSEEFGILVKPQAPICDGKYRADFLFTDPLLPCKMIVECDGHDFHERTKEQAAHDRRRDRDVTRAEYTVLRFTGSEIHRDAVACAREAYGQWTELRTRAYAQTEEGTAMLEPHGGEDAPDS